jgi:hypothetical protein
LALLRIEPGFRPILFAMASRFIVLASSISWRSEADDRRSSCLAIQGFARLSGHMAHHVSDSAGREAAEYGSPGRDERTKAYGALGGNGEVVA